MLNDSRLARAGHVHNGERRIADLAHAADGQSVHDDLSRPANIHRAGREFKAMVAVIVASTLAFTHCQDRRKVR